MAKTAIRRHYIERIKRKRRRVFLDYLGYPVEALPILVNTPVRCSCFLCGNRRKYEGPTKQERANNAAVLVDQYFKEHHDKNSE